MKNLFTVTAVIEFGTGLVLVALPSALGIILLDARVDTPIALTIARIAGFALLAVGIICWLARNEGNTRFTKGLAGAMLLYNVGAVAVFAFAALVLGVSGIALWPTVVLHTAMAGWCLKSMSQRS